jgi:hypothetical protein
MTPPDAMQIPNAELHMFPGHNFFISVLLCAILAAIKNPHPTSISAPAKICAYAYLPPSFWINCPAIGGPVKTAKLTMVKIIPILVPIILKFVVKLLKVAGNKL